MAGFFSKSSVKHSFIAVLIILVCALTLYSPIYSFSNKPKNWGKKRNERKTKQQSLGSRQNATTAKELSGGDFTAWKAPSTLTKIQHINNKSEYDQKSVAFGKRNMSSVYGDCYRYNSSGMQLLPPQTLVKNHCIKRLPKAVVIGVKKCGTMTLQQYLQLHTSITINGEIKFPGGTDFTAEDIAKWKNHMRFSSPRMYPMSESSGYLRTSVESKRHLKSFLPDDLKLIVIIRDPVTRAVSDYVHKLTVVFRDSFQRLPYLRDSLFSIRYRGDDLRGTFKNTVIDSQTGKIRSKQFIVQNGLYIRELRGLMKVYNRDQLLILDGHAFIEDPLPILRQVERFLGVPKFYKRDHFRKNPQTGFYCAHVPERPHVGCANPSIKGRPHPTIDNKTVEKLRDYYRPFNLELAKEFNLDFPWLFQ